GTNDSVFTGTNLINPGPPFLNNDFSVFPTFNLFFERDTNCGQSPQEYVCSCDYDCGLTDLGCCNNYHNPEIEIFDADNNPANGISSWSVKDGKQTLSFRVNCKG